MIDRRALVLGAGGCGAGLALGAVPRPNKKDLYDLGQRLRAGGPERALKAAEKAMVDGYSAADILGAVFLVGVIEVKPRHVGGKLHCVMMVNSALQLIDGAGPREAYLAALWNLNDLKVSQDRDRRDHGDWKLHPAPKVEPTEADAAARAFRAAMDRWDEEGADQAIVNLAAASDRDFTMEALWPYAARHFASIGHNIIFAAQIDRTLDRIGWEYAVPALRSLVFGLLHEPRGKQTGAWQQTGEALKSLPEEWAEGRPDAAQSAALAGILVASDRGEAIDAILKSAQSGTGRRVAWDALALAASRIVLARSSSYPGSTAALLCVHGLTENEAFRYVAGRTQNEGLRRRLLLQSAAWLVDVREFLRGRRLLQDTIPYFPQGAEVADPGGLDALWIDPDAGSACRVLHSNPRLIPAFKRRIRSCHFLGAREHHQPKYAAAALTLSSQVAPELAPSILSPLLPYVPTDRGSLTPVAERSLAAMKRAGII